MPKPVALLPEQLRRKCELRDAKFRTSQELQDLKTVLGQQKAVTSLRFGLTIRQPGFNVFVLGPSGVGKRQISKRMIAEHAVAEDHGDDWCYVENFGDHFRPKLLRLPKGLGPQFRDDLDRVVQQFLLAIPRCFVSEVYRGKEEGLLDKYPNPLSNSPTHQAISHCERTLALTELRRETARPCITHFIEVLKERYARCRDITDHLDAMIHDVVKHVEHFRLAEESEIIAKRLRHRYSVNVLVSHAREKGAPVCYVDNPTPLTLVGHIDRHLDQGTDITDFSTLRAGALQKANGGYLIINADQLFHNSPAWECLKSVLRTRFIQIQQYDLSVDSGVCHSLEPDAMPLEVKIVLIGDRNLYYSLHQSDPEFTKHFKVAVEFNDAIERNEGNELAYARWLATIARQRRFRPFDKNAVRALIEHSARLAEDAGKLTLRIEPIIDTLAEADFYASQAGRPVTGAAEVHAATKAQISRIGRIQEKSLEAINSGSVLLKTEGSEVGVINGLTVMEAGDALFSAPSRITARVRMGEGELVDIEREVDLGGPAHSKGVLILMGFLGVRYARHRALSLTASLCFEQSYGEIDGDSASSAELYALLSAIAAVPIQQSLAVTGSVNQNGEIQAVGAINEKIEGFFDICRLRGLNGTHGVLIPAGNITHLMLREAVVDAVAAGKFHIYPVGHVDEGIEILTGMRAGQRNANGQFPTGSFNQIVEDRLIQWAESRQEHSGKRHDDD